jgi:large subunit ribosomal protein L35
MPKMKTRKAAAKRFQITKSGKILRRQAKTRHLLECKSANTMRHLGREVRVAPADEARVRSMLRGG